MMSTASVSHFSIHGLDLSFHSTSSAISTSAQHHLRYFLQGSLPPPGSLRIIFEAVNHATSIPVTISPTARRLFSRPVEEGGGSTWIDWPCEVSQDHTQLIINFFSRGLLLIDGYAGEARGYLVNPESMHPDLYVRFVHSALVELLKWKKFYTIHATALEKDGWGVLITGASGQGKTTTFLSLLRSGYRCLSDDHPFIHENGNAIEVLAFPDKVNVRENTINLFPELKNAGAFLHQGMTKRYFYVEDLYPAGIGRSCVLKILLFPHVVDQSTSWLEPIPKSQALADLLPHGLLVYNPQVAKQEFQTLTNLVQQVDCFRLHFGRDVLEVPRLIDPILEKAKEHEM
ncbi:MAG: hypothetical protein R3B74_00365 [Nitrospirales bacterium]|nr:hypothetical protein [Nitrospirales bacterium]